MDTKRNSKVKCSAPTPPPLSIVNAYGNVDLSEKVLSRRYLHVRGKRLGPICNRLRIRYAKAVVGFSGSARYGYRPVFDGVVVSVRSAPRLAVAIRERDERAARRRETAIQSLSVLAALFTLNRRAKRCRDLAQEYYSNRMHGFAGKMKKEKEIIYDLKGQAIHYLIDDGVLTHEAYHKFDGGNWAELLTGDGYTFHRPCPPPQMPHEASAECRSEVEAKPKGTKEPTLEVAYEVVSNYLGDKPKAPVYCWPSRIAWRSSRNDWDDDDGDWDEDAAC